MIKAMVLVPGTHAIGPHNGTLRVHTYREGMAQHLGHDLVLAVNEWEAKVEVDKGGTPTAVALRVDPRSLNVHEGRRGVKPLTVHDRAEIDTTIDRKILRRQPVTFRSSRIELAEGALKIDGELRITGNTRPVSFELKLSGDGRVSGTLPLGQSAWGIRPYRAFMGALRVRDEVEVVLEANLPSS